MVASSRSSRQRWQLLRRRRLARRRATTLPREVLVAIAEEVVCEPMKKRANLKRERLVWADVWYVWYVCRTG